mgnify:CR=1 FL=1
MALNLSDVTTLSIENVSSSESVSTPLTGRFLVCCFSSYQVNVDLAIDDLPAK